jgi:PKD domain
MKRLLTLCAAALLLVLCAPAYARAAPAASFLWSPVNPLSGETITFASTSYDPESPITGQTWNLEGGGDAFVAAGPVVSTVFATPGSHLVRLRVTAADGSAGEAAQAVVVGSPAPVEMLPFPVVRLVATDVRGGVRVRLLSVEMPPGAQVAIRCAGRGCPLRYQSKTASSAGITTVTVAFPRFRRFLPAGVILELRVSKAGDVGKFTRIAVRRRGPAVRLDECLPPVGAPRPCA